MDLIVTSGGSDAGVEIVMSELKDKIPKTPVTPLITEESIDSAVDAPKLSFF